MNIQDLIRKGESETVEFKESFGKEALVAIGAFANTKGGTILVGLTDAGKAVGATLGKETLKTWANDVSMATEPRVVPDFEDIEIDGKPVVVVRVQEHPLKPVAVRGRCFRRVKDSNRGMTPHEIADMHLLSTNTSWDMYPMGDATVKDIDLAKVRRYMADANAAGRRDFGPSENPLKVLEKMELLKKGKVTYAALLLFGSEPQNKLVQATVHIGRFKEQTMVLDDALIKGTVIDHVNGAMAFVRKNISVKFVMTGMPKRDEVWDYPLDAVREAIINAVCHRDYTDNSDIQIKIHDDRMTIWNPGGLWGGMTMEELYSPTHASRPRNKLLGQIFYDLKYVERYGRGIKMILDLCQQAGIPVPVFQERFGGFMVTFRKDIYTEEYLATFGLNGRQVKAVLYVKERGAISNKIYQELNKVSKAMATIDLRSLSEKGLLRKKGRTGRGTEYVLAR